MHMHRADKHLRIALQIVVLAGGTNDFHAAPPVQEQWTSDNLIFMSEVNTRQCIALSKGPRSMH